ncbi:MAG: orotidine-5'-phosphate decarboxylase [Elusimicrobiota bacterium]
MAEIILALDYDDIRQAGEIVSGLKNDITYFKIGLQLFSRYGPRAVEMVKAEGKEVFLDLKYHDIPRTCRAACIAAADLGCYSATIHIQAGPEALESAQKARKNGFPRLWGVTILSSIQSGNSYAAAETADKAGLQGLIVSGKDVADIRSAFPDMDIVVPGIRPSGYLKQDDQKRVMTPSEAVENGADFLVIGRPITEADDPVEAARAIKEEMQLS